MKITFHPPLANGTIDTPEPWELELEFKKNLSGKTFGLSEINMMAIFKGYLHFEDAKGKLF